MPESPWAGHWLFLSPGRTVGANPSVQLHLLQRHHWYLPLFLPLHLRLSAQTQPCRSGEPRGLPDRSSHLALPSACWQKVSGAGLRNCPHSCPVCLLPAAHPRRGVAALSWGRLPERTGWHGLSASPIENPASDTRESRAPGQLRAGFALSFRRPPSRRLPALQERWLPVRERRGAQP